MTLPVDCVLKEEGSLLLRILPAKGGSISPRVVPPELAKVVEDSIHFLVGVTDGARKLVTRIKRDRPTDWSKVYGPKLFSHDDLIRLSETARKWANLGSRVVISYRECSEFRDLFGDCIEEEISVSRNIGGFKNRRNNQKELIAVLS